VLAILFGCATFPRFPDPSEEADVKFGAWMYQRAGTMDVVEFARVAEQCGFDSVWQGEHSHRPVTQAERQQAVPDGLHDHAMMLDQFVVLSAWAAVTSEVRLGTAITLLMERDPIWLAKELASLDQISGGRAMLGIGGGHMYEPYLKEMKNHGTDPNIRWDVLRERALAVREILAKQEPEFHGKYVDFDPIWAFPKPVQQPHPPILLGSSGYSREFNARRRDGGTDPDAEARSRRVWGQTLDRLLEYCDGWMPVAGEPDLGEKVAELQRMAKERGRAAYDVTVFGAGMARDRQLDDALVERLQAAGVNRIIFTPPPAAAETVIPELQRVGELAKRHA